MEGVLSFTFGVVGFLDDEGIIPRKRVVLAPDSVTVADSVTTVFEGQSHRELF